MKTFLCILAVVSVANATLELDGLFGGDSRGSSRGNSRGVLSGGAGGNSRGNSGGSSSGNFGDVLGSGLQGLSSLFSGKGPRLQLDHNVNVVHNYPTSQGGEGGGYGGNGGNGEIIEQNGGGGYNGGQQEVRVIRVIHEEAAPAYLGQSYGSEGHVKVIKVLHQESPQQIGWGW